MLPILWVGVGEPSLSISVDGSTEVGAALVKVFTRLLVREFGEMAFEVRRVAASPGSKSSLPSNSESKEEFACPIS